MEGNDIDDEVIEEGCYYLSKLGLSDEEIAKRFEIDLKKVKSLKSSYEEKIKCNKIIPDPYDKIFWEHVKKEAEGDTKLTFLSRKGFHHAWRSELEKLDAEALMEIYEASKEFLDMDPYQRLLNFQAPKGFDPLALQREVKRAVGIIYAILQDKWVNDNK